MAFKSTGIQKPSFGGKRKTGAKPPSKKVLEAYGGAPTKAKPFEMNVPGNKEFGFIQNTPKKATGAMMGRAAPSGGAAKTITRSDSRKQFKPKGRKVF